MSFFVNPAIAAGVLLSVTGLSAVAHAALPPQQPTCSAATIAGTYKGSGSGMSSLEHPGKGKVEPETHTVEIVADGMGNYVVVKITHFVRDLPTPTRQFTNQPGTYTVDGACNVAFTRVGKEDKKARIWIGTVTRDGNTIDKRTVQADYQSSHVLVRVPPR